MGYTLYIGFISYILQSTIFFIFYKKNGLNILDIKELREGLVCYIINIT